MADLLITLHYDEGSGTWDATASKDGSPEYDTGPAKCRTTEAALYVLADVLYRELDRTNDGS
jgi:hypothetical protein